jgi:hypothetical protein
MWLVSRGFAESLMEEFIPAKIVGRCDMWYKNQGVKQLFRIS